MSGVVTAPIKWIDSFFGDKDADAESNKSFLRVKLGGFLEEGRGVGDSVKVNGKIVLPRTGKRLNVLIGGDGDDESDLESAGNDEVRERITEKDKQNVGLGLQYFLHRSQRSNVSTAGGVRLRSGGPVGILSGRFRYSLPLDSWLARYVQEVEWLTDDGLVIPSTLEFDRHLTEDLLFRTSFGGAWYEEEDGYFYGAGMSIGERLDSASAISYQWSNQFRTEPNNRLEEVALRVRYRRTIWRKWLKLDLSPRLSFPRERDFDPTPGIFAGFEIKFGG